MISSGSGGDAVDKVTTINGLHGVQIYKIEPYCTVKPSCVCFKLCSLIASNGKSVVSSRNRLSIVYT